MSEQSPFDEQPKPQPQGDPQDDKHESGGHATKAEKADPCVDLKAARAEADAAADDAIAELERLRRELAEAGDDCGCAENEQCIAEATAGFRAVTARLRAALGK